MESIEQKEQILDPEIEAERKLEELLEDPDNAFLHEHKMHINRIENVETAVEALAIAESIIMKRLEATFKFNLIRPVEGVETDLVNLEGIRKTLDTVKANQEKIGEGGDAYVVIAKTEIKKFPPEVCYKFAKAEATPRGRNPMAYEAELQSDFYEQAQKLAELHIGVPEPYYSSELGHDKLIAMEKLPAKSVDDILRGIGSLPEWFDIDRFCDNLEKFLNALHEQGLYHRDMHVGNVMIRQSIEEPADGWWGYVIDFGLSGYGAENMDPYRKEMADMVFTYHKDDDIINEVRQALHRYQNHNVRKEV